MTPFKSENEQKYDLLLKTWQYLETSENPQVIFLAFILRFLKLSGYSFIEYLNKENTGISEKEKALIKRIATTPGTELEKKVRIDKEMQEAIKRRLNNYLSLYLSRPLSTDVFVNKIKKAGRFISHPDPGNRDKLTPTPGIGMA
jgi:hypothetical protein